MSEPTSPPENTATPGAEIASREDKSLDQLLSEAQAKVEEHRNAWLRALADADNARKRAQADIAQARKFAVERFVEDLVPVMDSLEAALATPSTGDAPLRSGVELDGGLEAGERGVEGATPEVLLEAFETDVRPLLARLRAELGLGADPVEAFRAGGHAERLARERGVAHVESAYETT